jgi:hypothetical protein
MRVYPADNAEDQAHCSLRCHGPPEVDPQLRWSTEYLSTEEGSAMKKSYMAIMLMLIIMTHIVWSQVPQTMSYQGVLTDGQGSPLSGTFSLTFRMYEQADGGTAIWEETNDVEAINGIFNTILGCVTPLSLPFDKQYWLGITIGTDAELTPRIALTASPYSLNAKSTLVEPDPGQGLTIRDSSGGVTHMLSADGDFMHTGDGYIAGGLAVERYIRDFESVKLLSTKFDDVGVISRIVRLTPSVVKQYLDLVPVDS